MVRTIFFTIPKGKEYSYNPPKGKGYFYNPPKGRGYIYNPPKCKGYFYNAPKSKGYFYIYIILISSVFTVLSFICFTLKGFFIASH
jgi:hypothetical protein